MHGGARTVRMGSHVGVRILACMHTRRAACAELGRLLIYEAMRDFLPTVEQQLTTPLGVAADCTLVDPSRPIKVAPHPKGGARRQTGLRARLAGGRGYGNGRRSPQLGPPPPPGGLADLSLPACLRPRPPPALPQVVPVLRAGLVLLEQAAQVIPIQQTYHVGYVRDPTTLKVGGCRGGGGRQGAG